MASLRDLVRDVRHATRYTLPGQGEPESLIGYRFSADFFPMLGREPLLGRVFVAGEDRTGADRALVDPAAVLRQE